MAYDVIVVGSILVDIPVWVARDPMPGETLVVQDSGMFAGGKGLKPGMSSGTIRRPSFICWSYW